MAFWEYRPYVSVAQRQRNAAKEVANRTKQGHKVSPVRIDGRTITKTFWGNSWCENLERYSDYANRLPRGRTYVRNGSVVDLQIRTGAIEALVSGSDLYEVSLTITPVAKTHWTSICKDCTGAIDSLVELLQGRFSKSVMERICRPKEGLFPSPREIKMECSCPDSATMCKHVAAVLYGVGSRLDHNPELLFLLRGVDEKELIAKAAGAIPTAKKQSARVLDAGADLADIFGLDMASNKPSQNKPSEAKVVKKAAKKAPAKKGPKAK